MRQSALLVAALFAMFIVFVAINGRLAVYTDVLWGGGGKGGGTIDPKAKTSGDGPSDAAKNTAHVLQALLPYPLSIPFDLMDTTDA